jgi:uncharacterized FAD-dependent dehydrogenase
MQKQVRLELSPETAFNEARFQEAVHHLLKLKPSDILQIQIIKRSIDARGRQIKVAIECIAYINEVPALRFKYEPGYKDVHNSPEVIIVGFGPAGMFAALRLIELGMKPVIYERGKDVQTRRRDLAAINREHIVNPDSNYCFGEGGAGTYSDGKLYTRSTKRGDVMRILETMVRHGASEEILYDAHPHIGTNKLPKLVTALRETIEYYGGEVHFNHRVTDLILDSKEIKGVITNDGGQRKADAVILATGHSARDIYFLLHDKKIAIESKPFAIGVRVEHRQELIDKIQYHDQPRGDMLPAAAYSLVCQTLIEDRKRGVFSFCMCPGGFIVAAATSPGEVVVNGMSPSKRDNLYANSGIVVSIDQEDIADYSRHGPLSGLMMQTELEKKACQWAGGTQKAPAQLLADFVNKKHSSNTLNTSYIPGLTAAPLHELLPENISVRLQFAFKDFGNKMKGYLSNEAQIIGVESRTSSPVRIPRDKDSLEHIQIKRLFPCGEGAGFAGGIVSAAMDGEKCAEKVALKYS